MLEPPDLSVELLAGCVSREYGRHPGNITFLPLGADVNTAVFRVTTEDGRLYFLKLRRGDFDAATVAIPHLLHSRGNTHIIAPILTVAGELRARVESSGVVYHAVLYPFVPGHDAYDVPLSPDQWRAFGVALRDLHRADLPPAWREGIPVETYGSYWRDMVSGYQAAIECRTYSEPVAAATAAFLRTQREAIADVLMRADRLAAMLITQPLPPVLCHGDIHAWNLLISAHGALYVVDWDTLVYAPKERDLMFIGAGIGGIWRDPEEAAWFYEGYGAANVNPVALAYYRYERIIEDIAAFAEQLLATDAGGADRPQSLHYLVSTFLPGNTIDVAYRADTLAY